MDANSASAPLAPLSSVVMFKKNEMKCFARWRETKEGLCFRDQTILQFGDSWDLIANFILLNPGSAVPIDRIPQNEYLKSKRLPFYIDENGEYYRFTIDRLMNDLLKLYSTKFGGGVIKIYNLFNLKNQNSGNAIEQYKQYKLHPFIHTKKSEIKYGNAPVVIATGSNIHMDRGLKEELKKYIALANQAQLYALVRHRDKTFAIKKVQPDDTGIIESYHPSYTFKYGNTTKFI